MDKLYNLNVIAVMNHININDKYVGCTYHSPVGDLFIAVNAECVLMCDWTRSRHFASHFNTLDNNGILTDQLSARSLLKEVIEWLDDYFAGRCFPHDFSIKAAASGFHNRVYAELMSLRPGERVSYKELATRIGNPGAVRAVASALAVNPVSLLRPCHRIVSINPKGGGYAGGVVARDFLLRLERSVIL